MLAPTLCFVISAGRLRRSKIAGKTDFVSGSKTFKKETLKKHGESHTWVIYVHVTLQQMSNAQWHKDLSSKV